jgi:Polyketide cyclase / dehydrase and lipid transport
MSQVTLDRPRQAPVRAAEGPLEHLTNTWTFVAVNDDTLVAFAIDFQFKSHLLDHVANGVFHQTATRTMNTFSSRVHLLPYDASPYRAASVNVTLRNCNLSVGRAGVVQIVVVAIENRQGHAGKGIPRFACKPVLPRRNLLNLKGAPDGWLVITLSTTAVAIVSQTPGTPSGGDGS